jgi:DNA-binding NarL/FixJ family response regulator
VREWVGRLDRLAAAESTERVYADIWVAALAIASGQPAESQPSLEIAARATPPRQARAAGRADTLPESPEPLTEREREVTTLLARGVSKRQIPATLVISESTAEVHLKHILSKLGLRSRSQVAAWAAQRDLHV